VLYRADAPMPARMANNYDTQLGNLWRSLAMALNAAQQAQDDYNVIRMKAGLPPFQAFRLSAAMPVEARPGPRPVVRLSAEESSAAAEMMILGGMVNRGEAGDFAAARKLRLVEKNR
jgi:hypothetical protein